MARGSLPWNHLAHRGDSTWPLRDDVTRPAVLLLLGCVIAIAYWNSLSIGFEFDDSYQIVQNPSLRSLRNVPRFFYDPTTASSTNERIGLRPVLLVTYALNYAVSGMQPWSYHVLQAILHLVAAALVFIIVRDHLWWPAAERGPLGRARIPAAACAFFFALAPLNSHSLDYMSARSAILDDVPLSGRVPGVPP